VVIPASMLGKLKTVVQVAMVMCLIAVGPHPPLWATLVVYVTVVVTVLSGADYFFGLRRHLQGSASSQARRVV
jgi:CDP-diacylglycerol--glycerol-3-phosphate 3-phosphatidyltransferase